MQGEACARGSASSLGDAIDVLRVRSGNHGAVQAHAGPSGVVPVVFSEAAKDGGGLGIPHCRLLPALLDVGAEENVSVKP